MAGLTHNGVKVSIPSAQVPSGYSLPSVTEFTDYEYVVHNREFTIAKSGVENATAATTLTNLITQLDTDIETFLTADYHIDTLTVTAWSEVKVIRSNNAVDEIFWTTGTNSYICVVDIYVKTA